MNEQEAREIMLEPWRYVLSPQRGNAHALMSSFNRVGTIWSSANHALMTDFLRDELGFDGVVLTDMVDAQGASYMTTIDGLMGGTDLWFSSAGLTFAPYRNNPTVVNAMRESTHRIMYVTANYSAAMNGMDETMKMVSITPWWQTTLTTLNILLTALSALAIAMYVHRSIRDRKEQIPA